MSQEQTHDARWADAHRDFAKHVATMPRWHQLVVMLGLALLIAGAVGWLVSRSRPAAAPTTPPVAPRAQSTTESGGSAIPGGSSGFVGGGAAADHPMALSVDTPPAPATPPVAAPADDFLSTVSPHATRIGGSVVAGLVIGWLLRAFVKTVLFIALLIGGGLFALSYFGVINVDFSTIRENYADKAQWLAVQAYKLKDVAVAHLPSAGAGTLGAYLGFRRR